MCDAPVADGARFCGECGAPQIARPVPATPASVTAAVPAKRTPPAWVAPVAVVALLAVAAALPAAIVLLGRGGDARDDDAARIAIAANRALDGLDQAALSAKPGEAASMAALRAAAARTATELSDAQIDVRALALERGETVPALHDLQSALAADEALARALTPAPAAAAATIEKLSADAVEAAGIVGAPRLGRVETPPLVAALRAHAKHRAAAAKRHKRSSKPASTPVPAISYVPHTGLGYQAQIPSGYGAARRSPSRRPASSSARACAARTGCS